MPSSHFADCLIPRPCGHEALKAKILHQGKKKEEITKKNLNIKSLRSMLRPTKRWTYTKDLRSREVTLIQLRGCTDWKQRSWGKHQELHSAHWPHLQLSSPILRVYAVVWISMEQSGHDCMTQEYWPIDTTYYILPVPLVCISFVRMYQLTVTS